MSEINTMQYQIPTNLGQYLSQSQAAALAVLVANIRAEVEETRNVGQPQGELVSENDGEREVMAFCQELEAVACASITRNDGNVVHWIGVAAKQMNPLLS